MKVYSVKDVARMLDLSAGQVRSWARAGLLDPERGRRGEMRFSFQDLVLLRTAKGLISKRIPPARVRRTLQELKSQLPAGRPLSGVQIRAVGDAVVVKRAGALWDPQSGQAHFDFDVDELAQKVAPHANRVIDEAEAFDEDLEAEDWYGVGLDLEVASPEHARDAYRRALEMDPGHVDARINLGRLLQEIGQFAAAEAHYRGVLDRHPDHPIARFNLGVALEDQGRIDDALEAYRAAVRSDPTCADAYFNLSRLLEKTGDPQGALRALQRYRKLRRPDSGA